MGLYAASEKVLTVSIGIMMQTVVALAKQPIIEF
jgi:hypothetical protein